MGLLDDLEPAGRLYACRVREIRDSLEPEDVKKLDTMLADPNWPTNTLSKALQSKGLNVRAHSIRNHREKTCSCSKI